MYVCICRQITDNQIRDLCRDGTSSLSGVREKLGVASECGKCCDQAQIIVNEFNKKYAFVNVG